MKSTTITRTLLAGLLAVATAVAPLDQEVSAGPPLPQVPTRIKVPAGNQAFLVAHAVGVQIYRCNAATPEWVFVAPRANLYNDKGKLFITHFGGPTWQAKDGSTAVGTRVDGVTVDPTAIPWLLLSAVGSPGTYGDRLEKTTFIQRTSTTGGLAPNVTECTAATNGSTREIPYTADYTFWK